MKAEAKPAEMSAFKARWGHLLLIAGFSVGAGPMVLLPRIVHAAELDALPFTALPNSTDKRLHDYIGGKKDHIVVINFWASWCEPCREELPGLQRLAKRWQEQGVTVVTVAVADSPKRVVDFFWESSVDLPVIDDREQTISHAWGAHVLPTTLILDRHHRIRYLGTGPIDWDSPTADQKIQRLLK